MAKSRYENVPTIKIKGKDVITSASANINRRIPIDKIKTKTIEYNGIDGIDKIAHKYLGDSRYWWVIAKLNNLYGNVWRIEPGSKLIIPENKDEILDFF